MNPSRSIHSYSTQPRQTLVVAEHQNEGTMLLQLKPPTGAGPFLLMSLASNHPEGAQEIDTTASANTFTADWPQVWPMEWILTKQRDFR
jgi:hypothetical protein